MRCKFSHRITNECNMVNPVYCKGFERDRESCPFWCNEKNISKVKTNMIDWDKPPKVEQMYKGLNKNE